MRQWRRTWYKNVTAVNVTNQCGRALNFPELQLIFFWDGGGLCFRLLFKVMYAHDQNDLMR